MKKTMTRLAVLMLSGSLLFVACKKEEEVPVKTLYERLGGKDAISLVVDQFIANVAADSRINTFFAKTVADKTGMLVTNLRNNLINQIGEATGGPLKYTGKDMVTAHKGMNIKDADFNALVDDLVKALDKYSVPTTEKNELLSALAAMKPQIVGV
jgi:truncated hemoglobin YjbI